MDEGELKLNIIAELENPTYSSLQERNAREALLIRASLQALLPTLSLDVPTATFVPILVDRTASFGSISKGKPAMVALLHALKTGVGVESQARLDGLADEWRALSANRRALPGSRSRSTVNRFWVIFDTCTLIDYYKDLHAILALPRGHTIRYNYSRGFVANRCVNRCLKTGPTSEPVLLVYGQYEGFRQRDDHTKFAGRRMLWVPTRVAELIGLEAEGPAGAEKFYFDLKLGDYPLLDDVALAHILDDLRERKECPFDKWVTFSTQDADLNALRGAGTDSENWARIVEWFRKDSQFHADSFWRLEGPFAADTGPGRRVEPEHQQPDRGEVQTVYRLRPECRYFFNVINREPREDDEVETSGRIIKIDAERSELWTKSKNLPLRQYFTQNLLFEYKKRGHGKIYPTQLELTTKPRTAITRYPSGPKITLALEPFAL